jgi:hypothetical protein
VDAWVKAGAFTDRRVVTHLARLRTGEVLAVGADNVCGVATDGSDTAEIGDPVTGKWKVTDRLPSRRVGPVLVALADGRALVTGGNTGESEGAIAKSSTVVFEPAKRRWSSSGLLNTARSDLASTVLLDGRVIVAGGLYLDRSNAGRALDSVELWDPTTGKWSPTGSLSAPRLGAAAATLTDGTVLLLGGLPSWGADVERTTAETFDPATGHWSPAGTLAAPRGGFSLVALPDGGALVVGGAITKTVIEDGESFHPHDPATSVERYDPVAHAWSATNSLNRVPKGTTAVAMRDGRVLAVSGTDTEIYDPVSGTWSDTASIPGGRNDGSSVALSDGSVLVGGGWSKWPDTGDIPSCPEANPQLWRFVPGA